MAPHPGCLLSHCHLFELFLPQIGNGLEYEVEDGQVVPGWIQQVTGEATVVLGQFQVKACHPVWYSAHLQSHPCLGSGAISLALY